MSGGQGRGAVMEPTPRQALKDGQMPHTHTQTCPHAWTLPRVPWRPAFGVPWVVWEGRTGEVEKTSDFLCPTCSFPCV